MFEVMVESTFAAARQLLNYDGPCQNIHGHNFTVRIWAQSPHLDQANIAFDYKVMKDLLEEIIAEFDHTCLNDHPDLAGQSPSSEFIARYMYQRLKPKFNALSRIMIMETPTEGVTYFE